MLPSGDLLTVDFISLDENPKVFKKTQQILAWLKVEMVKLDKLY
jgi:hypothetical protein